MKYYGGVETEKAKENFGIGILPEELVSAYAEVKLAVLKAIQEEEKRFNTTEWKAIERTLLEVINGELKESFSLNLLQGGAGTSINMNLNEVVANRADELLGIKRFNPIEDINIYQSTNDTFPTAVTIMLYRKLLQTETLVIKLQELLVKKENEYQNILLTGRTEMQNALPINLGQVFGSWAGMIERDRWRIHKLKERVRTIPLGGTAVGTGYPVPAKIVFLAEKYLREITKLPLSRSQNLPDEVANLDKWSELANVLKIIAENIYKITGDLLIYTSSFVEEIIHPDLQSGSTIMAAKTNPVILEFVRGSSIYIQHECNKISDYCKNGQLQLNPFLPFVLESFIRVFDVMDKSINKFIERFFDKIDINKRKIEENLISSNVILNALVGVIGYNNVKKLFYKVKSENIKTIVELKELLKNETSLTNKEIDFYLDPINLSTFWRK